MMYAMSVIIKFLLYVTGQADSCLVTCDI